jgi:hypothetical protein
MRTTSKKIKEIGKALGVNLKVDKTLDKISNIVPEKMKETDKLLSNSKFNH